MVIAVESSHQDPDRGSSVGLYKPIKGHLMVVWAGHPIPASHDGGPILVPPV